MMMFVSIVFLATLVLILLLFVIKIHEVRSGRVLAKTWRQALDAEALQVKDLLNAAELDLKKVAPLVLYWARALVHIAALEFARAARIASSRAHALADFVSHKRNFQRGVTRSEFLKKMGERKNGLPDQGNGQE